MQSNSIEDIEKTTTKAFQLLSGPQSQKPENLDADAVQAGVKLLASLKGIGPATASLLLAVFAPESVPFFSDELFRWVMWEESGKPDGWKRVIKYNLKEYAEVFGRVQELRRRLGVRAVDAERVAWVLGKEGVDVGGVDQGAGCGEEGKKVEAKVGAVGEVQKKVESKKGAKRKVDEDTVQEPKAKQKKKDAPRTDTTQLRRSGRNKDD